MLSANQWAFKEWAAVCAALRSGRQSVILRKGGIHEGQEGFRVEHREFWLFPTQFHQDPGQLVPDARQLIDDVRLDAPPAGTIRLELYATVEEVIRIEDESLLPGLRGLHVLSDEVVSERYHYRTPGLFALAVRVHQAPQAIDLPDSPHFGGCRSWVDLPREISTHGVVPVLSDDEFRERLAQLRFALVPGLA